MFVDGFRYELFRYARTIDTTSLVIFCNIDLDTCLEWNAKKTLPYDPKLVEDVHSRIEIPSSNSRWDSPLYVIKGPHDKLPMKDIVFSIIGFKDKPRQENLEIPHLLSDSNFRHELDRITNEIVAVAIGSRGSKIPGDKIPIEGTKERMLMPKYFTVTDVKNIRMQFVRLTELNPPKDIKELPTLFVLYFNNAIAML